MTIKEINKKWDHGQLDWIKEFVIHNQSELDELPKNCGVGSTALLTDRNETYVLDRKGNWTLREQAIEEDEEGGNTGGGGGVTDYYVTGGYAYHDAQYITKVTKADVVEAAQNTIIRIWPPNNTACYIVTYVDLNDDYATLWFMDLDTNTECRGVYGRVCTAEWVDPLS